MCPTMAVGDLRNSQGWSRTTAQKRIQQTHISQRAPWWGPLHPLQQAPQTAWKAFRCWRQHTPPRCRCTDTMCQAQQRLRQQLKQCLCCHCCCLLLRWKFQEPWCDCEARHYMPCGCGCNCPAQRRRGNIFLIVIVCSPPRMVCLLLASTIVVLSIASTAQGKPLWVRMKRRAVVCGSKWSR